VGSVLVSTRGRVLLVELNRPERRNAVDAATAQRLSDAFRRFEADPEVDVAVLSGRGGTFCAGADLHELAEGARGRLSLEGDGPMGPTRMRLTKPVIAAIEGYAVAGGLELAIWCDLRVAAEDAVLGVLSRRYGVPLVDLGTIRLPRLIGQSHALDLILTGRPVSAGEALGMGLVNRVVPPGTALEAAIALAEEISRTPQTGLRHDRLSALEQWGLTEDEAIGNELRHGMAVIDSGETEQGARRFSRGEGRRGEPNHDPAPRPGG